MSTMEMEPELRDEPDVDGERTEIEAVVDDTVVFGLEKKDVEETGDSPASMPSMAGTSTASSQEGDDDVARELFVQDDDDFSYNSIVENLRKVEQEWVDDRHGPTESPHSITSSETTSVPSWNLSHSYSTAPTLLPHGSFPSLSQNRSPQMKPIVEGESEEDLERLYTENEPGVAGQTQEARPQSFEYQSEDPPELQPSCTTAAMSLAPTQLAEMFFTFEGTKPSWMCGPKVDVVDQAETSRVSADDALASEPLDAAIQLREDGWIPRAASLERECVSLKKIIEEDSVKILNLKQLLSSHRELLSRKERDIATKQFEVDISNDRIDRLKKEKDLLLERESELAETIRILKNEVDDLTRTKEVDIVFSPVEKVEGDSGSMDLADLKEDIASFTAQVVEQDIVIVDLQDQLYKEKTQNLELQGEVESLRSQHIRQQRQEISQPPYEDSSAAIQLLLENALGRLEEIEQRKNQADVKFLAELRKSQSEIEAIKATLENDHAVLHISEDPGEVEAILPKTCDGEIVASGCCCGAWSSLSEGME